MDAVLFERLLYEEESTTLDFKKEQYLFVKAPDDEKSELLKDTLGFANAWRRSEAYILIGVEDVRGGRSKVVGITEHLDDHSLQQFVNNLTNRPVQFHYEAFGFEGKQVGIIRIEQQTRPLYLRRDYGKLLKEKVYIRRGSSTDPTKPASIEEIALMGQALAAPVAAKLHSELRKLLRFPDAFPDEPDSSIGILEGMLINQLPRKLFALLIRYEEREVDEVPGIGTKLHDHMGSYYRFRQTASRVQKSMIQKVGQLSACEFPAAWAILFRYSVMRFGGISKPEVVAGGNFLNYGITWDEAERVYVTLSQDASLASSLSELFQAHTKLCDGLASFSESH